MRPNPLRGRRNSTHPTPSRVDDIDMRHKKRQEVVLILITADGDEVNEGAHLAFKFEDRGEATGTREQKSQILILTLLI